MQHLVYKGYGNITVIFLTIVNFLIHQYIYRKMKQFKSISIPRNLVEEIEKMIKDELCLYHTKSDFIIDAVRRHIEKTKKDIILERQHQEHMEAMGLK